MSKMKVLFLCTSNSARSQIAEAFLKKFADDTFDVYSAGLEPSRINPYTNLVMEELGISLGKQYSKHINEYLGKINFDFVITVCDQADKQCPAVFTSRIKKIHWSFEDPAAHAGIEEEILNKFREVRDQIKKRIKVWLTDQGI